jgi:hypothetical protein
VNTLQVNEDAGRPKTRWIAGVEEDARKLVAETNGRLPRMEVNGEICCEEAKVHPGL